jgi:Tfp pilus assembly protein PilN
VRPVNLIPPEARGERAPTRRGPLAYVVVGAMAVALIAVYLLVSTSNKIDERKAEIAALEQREQVASAQYEALRPYVEFATLAETRVSTVSQLATSRFDWDRVLNELALVIPGDIWLTGLTGTVSPDVQVEGGEKIATRTGIAGPALEIIGCGVSQDAVAGFVAALEDIDGVTRVGLEDSALPESGESDGGGGGKSGGDDCRTREFIAQFHLVIAFDEAPTIAADSASAPALPTAAATTPAPTTEAQQSVQETSENVDDAANIIPGVAR